MVVHVGVIGGWEGISENDRLADNIASKAASGQGGYLRCFCFLDLDDTADFDIDSAGIGIVEGWFGLR